MKIYLVGGAVRDKLLNLPVKERDWVVVGSSHDEMIRLGYTSVGKDFPVYLHPETKEEYALARKEKKSGVGYHGFDFDASKDVSLEEDLLRRDLTINAIAMNDQGELFDPYDGQDDLNNGLLKHVSPAFQEDPVRVLRIARFASRFNRWGFRVSHGTFQLLQSMVQQGEVSHLTPERVWKELEKTLKEDKPSVFFKVLHRCGALEIIFPEIFGLFGIPQPAHHHPEVDTGKHTLMVLDTACQLSADIAVRFAALTHDLGKATSDKDNLPHHHGHEQRGIILCKQLCDRLRIPNEIRDIALLTTQYHTHCHRVRELKASTILTVLGAFDAFRRPQRLAKFLLACTADAKGRTGFEDKPYAQAEFLNACFNVANTVQVNNFIKQYPDLKGKQIGDKLRQLRIAAIQSYLRSTTETT
jgi:tRNA nucleotidyltransferase (CCA-adding enzyme)